jgi:hypothetical protein
MDFISDLSGETTIVDSSFLSSVFQYSIGLKASACSNSSSTQAVRLSPYSIYNLAGVIAF